MQTSSLLELNSNENSLGMAQSAREAIINSLDLGFRYPDDQRAALITKIAELQQVSEEQISLSNGSSENIRTVVQMLLFKALKQNKALQVIVPDPTFAYAENYAERLDVPVVKVPLTEANYDLDLGNIKQIADEFSGLSLIYLCNPNNPTATITDTQKLKDWVATAPANHYFLLDEAYAEYVTDPSYETGIEWIKQELSERLIVIRTFSKLCALASMRVGYAVAMADTINQLEAVMTVDNTNLAGAVAVLATLEDEAFLQHSLQTTQQSRQMIEQTLDELGLHYLPSQANFIFHEIKGDVQQYIDRMKEHGIVVGRAFAPITGYNRLTLGTPEEMQLFIDVLKQFRRQGWI